jgi:hypothetical protein
MAETRAELEIERADLAGKLGTIMADIEATKAEMAARLGGVEAEAQRIRSRLGQIDTELRRREAHDAMVPTISDHALLRYIERIHGVDVEAMKTALLTETVVLAIKSGATAVKSPAGTMVIKGSTVVTLLDPEMRPKRKTQRGMREVDDDWQADDVA